MSRLADLPEERKDQNKFDPNAQLSLTAKLKSNLHHEAIKQEQIKFVRDVLEQAILEHFTSRKKSVISRLWRD